MPQRRACRRRSAILVDRQDCIHKSAGSSGRTDNAIADECTEERLDVRGWIWRADGTGTALRALLNEIDYRFRDAFRANGNAVCCLSTRNKLSRENSGEKEC